MKKGYLYVSLLIPRRLRFWTTVSRRPHDARRRDVALAAAFGLPEEVTQSGEQADDELVGLQERLAEIGLRGERRGRGDPQERQANHQHDCLPDQVLAHFCLLFAFLINNFKSFRRLELDHVQGGPGMVDRPERVRPG